MAGVAGRQPYPHQGNLADPYKKHPHRPYVSYGDTVEEALCFGWIDSKPNQLDDARTMLWFAPRKPGTGWSALNKHA